MACARISRIAERTVRTMLTIDDVIERFDGSLAYSTNSKEICQYIADLLKELKERRKEPEVVFCKDCRKHNVKVGFDENFHTVWKEDACPLVDWRGKAKEHEFDYQYCAFAERRTE